MAVSTADFSRINQYLLGSLEGEEKLQIEARLLADDDLFASLELAEGDLIEDYVAGRLAPEERRQFEGYFLNSPKRRDQVEFARALYTVAEGRQPSPAPTSAVRESAPATRALPRRQSLFARPQFAAVAAACLALTLGLTIWLFVRDARLRKELEQERAARIALERKYAEQRTQAETLGEEKKDLEDQLKDLISLTGSSKPEIPIIINAFLSVFQAGFPRGGAGVTPQTLVVPENADQVKLQFPANTDRFPRLNLTLIRLAGTERKNVWKKDGVPAPKETSQLLTVRIPASTLKPGDYAVKLTGVTAENTTEGIGEYRFTVVR
jgi:anti-sigma-K factor RskA